MVQPDLATCAVCTDELAARLLWAEGISLVLFGTDAARLGREAATLRAKERARPGVAPARLAVFAGDPASAGDRTAALAMAREQFGTEAVLVASPAEAVAMLPAGGPTGSR